MLGTSIFYTHICVFGNSTLPNRCDIAPKHLKLPRLPVGQSEDNRLSEMKDLKSSEVISAFILFIFYQIFLV